MVGAVGATTLSFIMPSLLHLRLFGGDDDGSPGSEAQSQACSKAAGGARGGPNNLRMLGPGAWAADLAIAALGVFGGGIGLVVTIQGILGK